MRTASTRQLARVPKTPLPAVPAEDPIYRPDFTDAELAAGVAAKEFADTAALEGRDVALKQLNSRVSLWANRFTNVRYRRYVYTVASCMDGESHTFRISQAALMAKYGKQHPGKKIGHTTIQQYNRAMAKAGIFDVIHHRQDSESEHPGAYMTTEYHVHFSRVLAGDQVVPHDFTQVSPAAKAVESDISNSRNKTSNGCDDGGTDGSGDGGTDVLFSFSSMTTTPTYSHTAGDEDTDAAIEPLGGDEDLGGRAMYPAHLLSRNTFKVWTGKSGQVVWYNLDRASKAPADARVVCLDPAEADYLWNGLNTGDRDRDYAARRAFLLAPPDAREEEVYQWQNAARIAAEAERQERAEREQAEAQAKRQRVESEVALLAERYAELTGKPVEDTQRYYSMTSPEHARDDLKQQIRKIEAKNAKAEADARARQARREAEAEAMKLISKWTPTLDGVDLTSVRGGRFSDGPVAYYIDVQTKAIRPARGMMRPGEARVFIQQSANGPVLVNQ